MQWDLQLSAAQAGDTLRITLDGRLGAAGAPLLAGRLSDAIADGNCRIVLDLRGLDYISSSGLLTIEAAAARLRAEGGWLRLVDAQPAVRVALELAGVDL